MVLDIERLRGETPGCGELLHFNNAGASLLPGAVINAMKAHIDLEARIGGYEAGDAVLDQTEQFYDHAASLLNCSRDEIAFVENATRAWDMAFYGFKFKAGDRIITGRAEYASNFLAMLQVSRSTGAVIDVIGNDVYGQLDVDELREKIDGRVKLIAIPHVPSQGGLINPAEKIGEIANKAGIPYLLDATQSVGQMPVDVKQIKCDFLCATGRKYLRGPRGTGILYAKKSRILELEPPFVDLQAAIWIADDKYEWRADARRFETWEQNIAAKLGLAAAIEYLLQLDRDEAWERIKLLSSSLRQQLASIPGVTLHDLGLNKCGIVTFASKDKSPELVKRELAKRKINVSISRREYAQLDLGSRNISTLVRASVHYYNTEKEVEHFVDTVRAILVAKS